VRIFLADFGDLLGPLLLVLFAIMPRLFGSKKKGKKKKQVYQPEPTPQSVEYEEPEYVEVEAAPPPPPPQPVQDLPELAEVLQELLGREKVEEEIPPPYVPEPKPEPTKVDPEPPILEDDFGDHHALPVDMISKPVMHRRHHRQRRALLGDRLSLRQAVLLREILGPPRSLQALEKWENGGS